MSIPVKILQDGAFWLLVRSVEQSRHDNDFAIDTCTCISLHVLSYPLSFLCINCGSTMFDLYVQIIYFSLLACYSLFLFFTPTRIVKAGLKFEPVREKTNNLGLRPGQLQTRLYSHRKRLEA